MDHKLGSRGYIGKHGVWAKEDAHANKAGRDPPLSYLGSGRAKDFLRARTWYDKITGESIFEAKESMDVHDKLVRY